MYKRAGTLNFIDTSKTTLNLLIVCKLLSFIKVHRSYLFEYYKYANKTVVQKFN